MDFQYKPSILRYPHLWKPPYFEHARAYWCVATAPKYSSDSDLELGAVTAHKSWDMIALQKHLRICMNLPFIRSADSIFRAKESGEDDAPCLKIILYIVMLLSMLTGTCAWKWRRHDQDAAGWIQVFRSPNQISSAKDRRCWERLLGPFGQLFLAFAYAACGEPQTLHIEHDMTLDRLENTTYSSRKT